MSDFTDSELGAFLDGTIDGEKETLITAQLESDAKLRERLEQLSGAGGFDRDCATVGASEDAAPEVQDLIEKIVGSVSEETPEPLSQSVYLRYLEPSTEENALGKLVDYEILEVIAAGAMGVVFRARDNQLERIVAIKMLSPLYAESDVAKERFRREAKAVAAIEHPHVISIYSVDQSKAGLPFLVMNYVNGQSLSDLLLKLDGRSLPVSEILRIGKAVAAGLDAAHQQGLVHRDIKPSNILLEGEGPGVWITDFGLVRGRSEMTLTRTNMFLGTPEFAAPEQCAGQLVDERSDLFSFGAVLYYLATSRRPFQGESFAGLVYKIVHVPHPSVREARKDLPDWLVELIDTLLSKDPKRRPESAVAVLQMLEKESSAELHANPSKSFRWWWAAAAGVSGLLILGLASAVLNSDRPEQVSQTPESFAEKVFSADGQRFESLQEAVDSVGANGVVEIATSGAIVLDKTIELPVDRVLLIRAASGFLPRLEVSSPMPILRAPGGVNLEGLEFMQPESNEFIWEDAALQVSNGPFSLINCRLLRPLAGSAVVPTFTGPYFPMIDLTGCSEVSVVNSEIYSPSAVCIAAKSDPDKTVSIHFRNSIVIGTSACYVRNHHKDDMELIFDRTFSLCRDLVWVDPSPDGSGGYQLRSSNSVFHGRSFFLTTANVFADEFAGELHWEGKSNLYSMRRMFYGVRGQRLSFQDMERFNWMREETGSVTTNLARFSGDALIRGTEEIEILTADQFILTEEDVTDPERFGPDPELVGPRAFEATRNGSDESG